MKDDRKVSQSTYRYNQSKCFWMKRKQKKKMIFMCISNWKWFMCDNSGTSIFSIVKQNFIQVNVFISLVDCNSNIIFIANLFFFSFSHFHFVISSNKFESMLQALVSSIFTKEISEKLFRLLKYKMISFYSVLVNWTFVLAWTLRASLKKDFFEWKIVSEAHVRT